MDYGNFCAVSSICICPRFNTWYPAGAALWCAGIGAQESILKAAVTSMAPSHLDVYKRQFLGGTFPNVFDFDAEIEFTIGKIGEDAETFTITKPTIIRVPAGVYHCPLNFKRIDKPVFFQAALMEPMFGGIYDTPEGPKEMRCV